MLSVAADRAKPWCRWQCKLCCYSSEWLHLMKVHIPSTHPGEKVSANFYQAVGQAPATKTRAKGMVLAL